jgi:uncharacterized protein with PQ loop repeat
MSSLQSVEAKNINNIRFLSDINPKTLPTTKLSVKDKNSTIQLKPIQTKELFGEIRWKTYYSQFMLFWAVVSHVWLLIQAIEIFQTKEARGISLPAFIVLLFGSVFWFIYGFFVLPGHNKVIVISAVVSFVLGLVVLAGIIMYGGNQSERNSNIIENDEQEGNSNIIENDEE